ncbi:MFS transporter [Natrarchaeobaculum aegyptiacum]|uniref:MFS transporter n=1 Tax=Natrarchaeobaculum aegyptiacum TaxID=745377 RepID=A0A2Z2HY68_9EURY|nr:MFS transporter [Natrarchaeobaculum aegyptiacum]ARS89984.1 MFS transporter [Natrarchaeobaculum aegyptiacum]
MQSLTDIVATTRRHWADGRGKVLAAISAGWFLSIGVRQAFPVLLPHLQEAYDLTLATAGLLLSVLWFAYAAGQLPGGVLADRVGEGTTMVVSMAAAAGTVTLIVLGGPTWLLFVATALFGFATALFGVVRLSALADVYPEQVGTAIGIMSAVGDFGNTILPPVASVLAVALAWQFGFGFTIGLFAVVAVGIFVTVPSRTSSRSIGEKAEAQSDGGGNRVAGSGRSVHGARRTISKLAVQSIALITAIQIVGNAVYQAFTGFFPTYLIEVKEFSPTLASGLFAAFFAFGIVVKPLAGRAYDRVGTRRTLVVVLGISGGALVLLPRVESVLAVAAVTALVSIMLGTGTVVLSYMTTVVPDEIQNTGLGTLRTIYMTVGAVSPLVFGLVADRGFFDEGFYLLAAASALALVLVVWLPER